jgi:RNA polymerase sigma factor (TIGR02999 family)
MSDEPQSGIGDRARLSNGTPAAAAQKVTQLLADWSQGDQAALEKLTPLVYEELRRLAHHYMERQPPGHTLQTTALVNEAYLRLAEQSRPSFTNRSHFCAVAAKAMRQILVNHANAQRPGDHKQLGDPTELRSCRERCELRAQRRTNTFHRQRDRRELTTFTNRGSKSDDFDRQKPSSGIITFMDRSVRVLLVMMRRLVRPYSGALSQERLREKPEEIVLYDDHFAANWRRSFDWKKRP